jgi:plastocyanin
MKRLCILVTAVATAAIAAGGSSAATPKLQALVADPVKITLTAAGKKVSSLKAGTYVIVVKDASSGHNFRLKGPGVSKATSVSAKGTFTWKVTLKKGTYTYVCDPHAAFMKGSFTVR